jgi:prepilin signal peptidase PulO-like enzyme (type II secretory pathway)
MEYNAGFVCYAVLVLFLIIMSVQDIRCGSVNAVMTAAFVSAGLLLGLFVLKVPLPDMCLALCPGICLAAASRIFGNAIGLGDALALLLIGTMNGIAETFTVFCTALALSLIPAAFLYIKEKNGKRTIPFLPFLCAGTIIVLIGKAG